MRHAACERKIFAFLDGRLSGPSRNKLEEHLAHCAVCMAFLKKVVRLRRAVTAAAQSEMSFERLDAFVERTVAEMARSRVVAPSSWAPWALSAAAAATLAIALAMPPRNSEIDWTAGVSSDVLVVRGGHGSTPVQATIVVADACGASSSLSDSRRPGEDELMTTDSGDVLRLAMASRTEVGIDTCSALWLRCLSDDGPTLELGQGRLFVSTPPHDFVQGIVVLAGGETFHVLYGEAEFMVENGDVIVEVLDGAVVAATGRAGATLGPGRWRPLQRGEQSTGATSIALPGSSDAEWEDLASSSAKENAPKRLRAAAALPDRVMREQISRVTPTLQKCYEAALKRSPDLTAVIEARLWIDARGAVARVKLGGVAQNPELRRCLEEAFVGLAFPAPDGGPVELVVPLRLYPDM